MCADDARGWVARVTVRVMLVGPYERDNLGDLLFPLVTERYLRTAEVVHGVPFAASTQRLLKRSLPPYGPLLERERFDVVWSVGGQLGGVDAWRAYRMGAASYALERAAAASPDDRQAQLRAAAGGVAIGLPYVPAVVEYAASAGALTVVNSAGLSTVQGADERHGAAMLAALRGASAIAVRDPASSQLLERHDIAHELAPDAVHALGILRPTRRPRDADVAIVQLSHRTFERLGHDAIAQGLVAAFGTRGQRVRLLPAGLANGHDDPADLALLQERLAALAPGLRVETLETRDPWALVDEIATARLVISTSLHLRIIASAYATPRVSLARRKVSSYARHWDPGMPFGVQLAELPAAVSEALASDGDPEQLAAARRLAMRADGHLGALAARVLERAAADTRHARAARTEMRRQLRPVPPSPSAAPPPPARRLSPRRLRRTRRPARD